MNQNWRKDIQLMPMQMFKNKQLKIVFRTNRRSLKYAPNESLKVNACARDPPWCYKNTQCSRQHRHSYSRSPGVICTNCFSPVPCSLDLQTMVSCYNFKLDKDLYPRWTQNWSLRSWPDTCIAFVNFSNTIFFRQHKWMTKLFFNNRTKKVFYLQYGIFGLLLVLQDSWSLSLLVLETKWRYEMLRRQRVSLDVWGIVFFVFLTKDMLQL